MTDEQQTPPQSPVVHESGFDWKGFYFSFNGRVNRQKFWLYYFVPVFIFGIIIGALESALGLSAESEFISIVFYLLMLWPSIAITAKRLHDRSKSGWWQLLLFVPIVNLWIIVETFFLKGTDGPNKYGPDPLK